MQSITQAKNALGSFLGKSRIEALAQLLSPEIAHAFAQRSSQTLLEEAIDLLIQDQMNRAAWQQIFFVLGDFAPNEQLANKLQTAFQKVSFPKLLAADLQMSVMALQTVTFQTYHLRGSELRQHLEGEVTEIAKFLAAREAAHSSNELEQFAKNYLWDMALRIASTDASPAHVPAKFGELILKIIEVWPAFGKTAMPIIQHLYETLPTAQAKQLCSCLVRLRAIN